MLRSENLVQMFLYQKLKIYKDKARNIYVRNTFVERDTSTAVLRYEGAKSNVKESNLAKKRERNSMLHI